MQISFSKFLEHKSTLVLYTTIVPMCNICFLVKKELIHTLMFDFAYMVGSWEPNANFKMTI
jgi:hypothetical protein